MNVEEVLSEDVRCLKGCRQLEKSHKVNCLRKAIDCSKNNGVTFSGRQPGDEIQGYVGPWSAWHRERAKESGQRLGGSFLTGTSRTGCQILSNIFVHGWPPEVLSEV